MLPIKCSSSQDRLIPWQPSLSLQERLQPYGSGLHRKCIVLPSDPEHDWILQSFLLHKPEGYSIASVTYIDNAAHVQAFEAGLVNMEQEAKRFAPRWSEDPQAEQRKLVIETWRKEAEAYPVLEVPVGNTSIQLTAAKVLFLWHGADQATSESICDSGFTYNATRFGSGIYFTTHANHAVISSSGHLFFACVSMLEPFPVLSDDVALLESKGAYQNYNAHYRPDEIVVFQKSQTLARFWVVLEPDLLRSLNTKDKEQASLLSLVEQPYHQTLSLLLEKGGDPNSTNASKQTLLHLASKKGLLENVACLLKKGAKINAKDLSHRTPLFLAAQSGHLETLRLLLQNKGDPCIVTVEGETPLHTAAFYGYVRIVDELLKLSNCQKLINAKDEDDKTTLHKAVWGSPKPDVVKLLIENGANVNAENKFGYTPLHWAAKHGHAESAGILIQHGAKLDIVNANQALPFELAIRYGQDDFIRYFLGMPPKLGNEPPPKDIEGYYYKKLLEAKKEEQLEEQILYLQILSYHYVEKKDLLTASKILNCALAIMDKLSSTTRLAILQESIFHRLEQIEGLFFKSKGITKTLPWPLKDARDQLKKIRLLCTTLPIQDVLANFTREFRVLLGTLIADIQKILGKPPVKWACMGMGSMSRDEMCPYSDVEFAFLLEKESEKGMNYFRLLSEILELRIINLGETKFPIFGNRYPSPTPDGFCMDTGGNTPLGVTGVYELIGTPKTLAEFQKIQWMDRSIILPNAMSHVCFIAGKERFITEYNKEKKKVQELVDKKAKSTKENYKELSHRLLSGHVEEFAPNLSQEKEKTSAFGIKKELYRPFQEIIGSLALFYQLKTKTTFMRIDELIALEVFSTEGGENLKKALAHVLKLRLQAHLFYQNEEEFLCHPEEGKPLDPHLMYFNEETLQILQEIYRILIPFHRCAQEFLCSQSKKAFSTSAFYDDSSTVQGEVFDKNLQYVKAQQVRQEAVALNPNDVDALINLGCIGAKMGKNQNALTRYFKALELAQKKYGENHPDVAICYNNIGIVYNSLGEYEKALEYHQKSLKIKLQVLGENHPDVAASYNGIGNVYNSLGEYEKALEYHQKSLKIRLQVLGENHPDVADSYTNIGVIYDGLGEYEKALEYFQKSLKIGLQILGENHPIVFASYNNIGSVYDTLGEYEKAIEYIQKSLKIGLQVLGENHPDVAATYNSIGYIYKGLGEYEKALEYFRESLEMRCKIYKKSHPDILETLNDLILTAKKLPASQCQSLKQTYAICVEALGAGHESVKELLQLIS